MKYCPFLFLFLISTAAQAQNEGVSRGVYNSFNDYKAGSTKEIDSFYLDSVPRKKEVWLGTYSVTPRFVKNDKKVKRIWGFYDGTQSWIAFQSDFFPIVIQNNRITFEAYGIIDSGELTTTGIIFGAIGAGIYAVAANAATKGERVSYTLDPNNGNVYSTEGLRQAVEPFGVKKLVIYRGTKKEMDAPMKFSVNDTLIGDFVPGSYIEIEITSDDNQVDICFGSGFEDCETILFTGAVQYVECAYTRKAELNDYDFLSVSQSEGEHNSVWSYDVQERREKRQRKSESNDR